MASGFASQAAEDAILKFAPVKTSLSEALQTAKENYGSTVAAGNNTATLSARAAQAALPKISEIYKGATAAQNSGATLVSQALANLSPAANLYKGEQAAEVQQELANLMKSKTSDESALVNDQVAAREGAQFNQLNAQQALQKTVAGLISKSHTTAQEQGAFAATEAEKLAQESEKLATSERNNARTTAASEANNIRTTSTSRANSAEHYGSGPKATTSETTHAASIISSIRSEAKQLAGEGLNRAALVAELTKATGAKSLTVYGPNGEFTQPQKTGEKGTHISIPGQKAYAPDVFMSAALDEALGGHLSKNTEDRLVQQGYSIKALGLHPWEPPPETVSTAPGSRTAAERERRKG